MAHSLLQRCATRLHLGINPNQAVSEVWPVPGSMDIRDAVTGPAKMGQRLTRNDPDQCKLETAAQEAGPTSQTKAANYGRRKLLRLI